MREAYQNREAKLELSCAESISVELAKLVKQKFEF
jgi:hypothetical protein